MIVKYALLIELFVDLPKFMIIDQVKVLLRKVDIVQLFFKRIDGPTGPTDSAVRMLVTDICVGHGNEHWPLGMPHDSSSTIDAKIYAAMRHLVMLIHIVVSCSQNSLHGSTSSYIGTLSSDVLADGRPELTPLGHDRSCLRWCLVRRLRLMIRSLAVTLLRWKLLFL